MALKTRKLTYWVAPITDDHRNYNVRARLRKELLNRMHRNGYVRTKDGWKSGDGRYDVSFGKIRKITVEYIDAFDLIDIAYSESAIDEGNYSE